MFVPSIPSKVKGKEKEKDWELVDALHGGVFSGTSPPSYVADEEQYPRLLVKEKKEKVGKSSKEWKMRWLVIRDGRLFLWKDRALDAQPSEELPLSSLSSVRETPVTANHLLPAMPKITTQHLVNIKFVLGPSKSPDSASRSRIGRTIVSLHIRLLDNDSHDHFLRVIYRSLRLSSTLSPVNDSPLTHQGSALSSSSPPTISSSWLALSRFKGVSPPDATHPLRAHSPTSSRSSSPQQLIRQRSRSRSPVSSFKHSFHHRHVRSLSRTQSTPSLSGMSRSSRSLSRDGEERFPTHPAVHPLQSTTPKRNHHPPRKINHRRSNLHLTSSPEKEKPLHTDSESYYHVSPSSITSSPHHQQKLSSSTSPPSVLLLPPHHVMHRGRQKKGSSDGPPTMSFVNWRESVIEKCVTAGRGEAFLKRVGKNNIGVWSPFQFDDEDEWDEDGMVFGDVDEDVDVDGASRPAISEKTQPRSRRASFDSDYSEFEWENWKVDASYQNPQNLSSSFDRTSSSGLSRSNSASDHLTKLDTYSWKGSGSITSMGKALVSVGGVTSKDVIAESNRTAAIAAVNGTVSFTSFADVVIGRARSKSVIAGTPRRPSTASSTIGVYSPERSPGGTSLSPWSPPPRSPEQHLASPSVNSTFYYPKRTSPGIPNFDTTLSCAVAKDTGQQKRARSSTVSNLARAPIAPPPSPVPPPLPSSTKKAFWSTDSAPPSAYATSARKRDSGASDMSLNSALNMFSPVYQPSPASISHALPQQQTSLKLNTSNLTMSGGGISISKASPVSAIRLKKPPPATAGTSKAKPRDMSTEMSKTQ